jgi:WD40 repeat protein
LQEIAQLRERTAILADTLAFYPKESLAMCMQLKPPSKPITHLGTWGTWEGLKEVTALASCSGTLIAGGADGYVGLLQESAADSQDLRLRQVGEGSEGIRSILDAGCLNNEYAYTVSFEAGHGQIQLWNLLRRTASSWVGSDTKGHPGMAFVAVPSAKGDLLLSTGDHDVRLWDVTAGKLNLKVSHFFDVSEPQSFAAGALKDGDFVYWDGSRLWRIPSSGALPILYAGPALANKAPPRN